MKRTFLPILLLVITVSICNIANGQINRDTIIYEGVSFDLKDDTLFSSNGLKFYAGKQLVVGDGAGEGGYYRSIIYKNAALVPSIWGQDMRYKYAIENHVNKKKSREKVKSTLNPGMLLTIKKIGYTKTAKPYFYMVSLTSDTDSYYCDLYFALLLKELLLKP